MIYEFHALDNPVLPFLYHEKTISAGPQCWRNWHENLELLYFIDGDAAMICDGLSYRMEPGDLFVVNSNCLHETHPYADTRVACLIIGQEFLTQNGLELADRWFSPRLSRAEIGTRFQPIMDAFHSTAPWSAPTLRLEVLQLLLWLLRTHTTPRQTRARTSDSSQEALLNAVRYIHGAIPGKITVEQVAAACSLSESHLMHAFKKTFGCTITTYVNRLRCEYAKHLLAGGSLSVQECGYRSGFSDPSYFSKVFLAVTGRSPTAYRRNHQKFPAAPQWDDPLK